MFIRLQEETTKYQEGLSIVVTFTNLKKKMLHLYNDLD